MLSHFLLCFLFSRYVWSMENSASTVTCYENNIGCHIKKCRNESSLCLGKECVMIKKVVNDSQIYTLGCINDIGNIGRCKLYSGEELRPGGCLNNHRFCCCTQNFCNDPEEFWIRQKIDFEKSNATKPSEITPILITEPSAVPPITRNESPPLRMAVTILLPMLALSILIVVLYYFYRKYKIRRTSRHTCLSQQQPWNPDALPLIKPPNCNNMSELCTSGLSKVTISHTDRNGLPPNLIQKSCTDESSATFGNGNCRALQLVNSAVNSYKAKQMKENQPWWRIDEVLVRGKMACVQKCSQMSHDGSSVLQQAVIKTLCDKNLWQNEVNIYQLPGINHPNILRFLSAEQPCLNQSIYWLILSYQELGSVYDYLQTNTLTWTQVLNIARGLSRGLNHLHEEQLSCNKPAIAHRDIKSKNVLLNCNLEASIADFGLALRLPTGSCFNSVPSQVGTHRYMSPEVLLGIIGVDRNAFLSVDVYSMALVLWEILSRSHLPPTNTPNTSSYSHTSEAADSSGDVFVPSPYSPPYDVELLGQRPDKLNMKDIVLVRNLRPQPCKEWLKYESMKFLWRTIQECWDTDYEARLSANCVAERIDRLLETESKLLNDLQNNQDNNGSPVCRARLDESSGSDEIVDPVHVPNDNAGQNLSNEDSAIESGTLDSGTGQDRTSLSSSKSSSSYQQQPVLLKSSGTRVDSSSLPRSLPLNCCESDDQCEDCEQIDNKVNREQRDGDLCSKQKHSSIVSTVSEPLTPIAGTPIDC